MIVQFPVRLTPRAGRDRVDRVGEDGVLRVRVAAPPVDGAANEALERLLAAELGVARRSVAVTGGATARTKVVAVEDVSLETIIGRWPGLKARV